MSGPERRSAVEAWVLSDPAPVKPTATPGRQVASSRVHALYDVRERISYLAKARAEERDTPAITEADLSKLMTEVTERQLSIQRLAKNQGLDSLASDLRRLTVRHSGRAHRLHRRLPEIGQRADVDIDGFAARLKICDCQ